MKKFLKILLIIILVLAALFWGGIFIISTMGGNDDEWKARLENIGSSLVGGEVMIGTLNDAQFYPTANFDAEDVTFSPSEGGVGPDIHFEEIHFSMPFWSLFRGDPVFENLNVGGLKAIGDSNWRINRLHIDDEAAEAPKLYLDMMYRGEPVTLSLEMARNEKGVTILPETPFEAGLGGLPVTGVIKLTPDYLRLADLRIGEEDQAVTGDVTIHDGEETEVHATFGQSDMTALLLFDEEGEKPSVEGEITFNRLDMQDMESPAIQNLTETMDKFSGDGGDAQVSGFDALNDVLMNMAINIKSMTDGEEELGQVAFDVLIRDEGEFGLIGKQGVIAPAVIEAWSEQILTGLYGDEGLREDIRLSCLLGRGQLEETIARLQQLRVNGGNIDVRGYGSFDQGADEIDLWLSAADEGAIHLTGSTATPDISEEEAMPETPVWNNEEVTEFFDLAQDHPCAAMLNGLSEAP